MKQYRPQYNSLPWFAFVLLLFASCSNTRHLSDDESLYTGADVSINDRYSSVKVRRVLQSDLRDAVRPRPNSKFLGMRLKLSLYNLAGDPEKDKGLRRWLRSNGEPPVTASAFRQDQNELLFVNLMENKGFFYSSVTSRTVTKRKKTKAYFDVLTGPQYQIRKIHFPSDTSRLARDIKITETQTLLEEGQPFNLDLIKGERDRITRELTEKGYYYFKSDYILIQADTSVGNRNVDVYVTIKKEEMPASAADIYTINKIFIFPDFRMRKGRDVDTTDHHFKFYEGYYIADRKNNFRPFIFKHAMQFQPGDTYNRTEQNRSLNRLVSLGVFKFVKNKFEPLDNVDSPKLDIQYHLIAYPKKSMRLELGVESQNDSRVGTLASLSWRNRNALKGAELFAITLRAGYEAQAGGNVRRPGALESGLQASLSIPRFLVPFIHIPPSNIYVPRTTIQAGYDISMRHQLYHIHSLKGAYGYTFKEDIRKEHRLFPLNITYVRTDTLTTGLSSQVNFSNIIFNGLIIGPTYEYTFNSQAAGMKRDNYFLNILAEFSNNMLGLTQGASPESRKLLFGTEYAQYMKFQVDGRYYMHYGLHENNMWASRVLFGYGHPYGNSRNLPNIKQFFSGGASSLRGFRSRMVGPGTFNEEYLHGTHEYIEQLGDVKLEISTEWRVHLFDFINGVIFADAGNIWMRYADARFPGGAFGASFYKELAMDAGLGLRLDFKIIVLRLDFAIPIRKPWLPEGNRWVLDDIRFGNSRWRKDNIIFNLAIGYPF